MKGLFKKIFGPKTSPTSDQIICDSSILPEEKTAEIGAPIINMETPEVLPRSENYESDTSEIKTSDQKSKPRLPYYPKLDLRDYKFPGLALFTETIQKVLSALTEVSYVYTLPVLWSSTENRLIIKDICEFNNLLITGAQVTGKTNFIHQLVISLLLRKHPSQLKFVFADIKGLELGIYRSIEKHFLAKLPGQQDIILKEPKHLIHSLNALCIEMDNRYDLLVNAEVRNITEYNIKFKQRRLDPEKGHQYLPFIILVIDDLGGYTYKGSPEINLPLTRLVSEGYKTGIYTIIGTSQTSGLSLPNNLLSMIKQRVVFRLNSKEDHKRFFDTIRFDIPLERGKFLYNDSGHVQTGQTILFSSSDIENLTAFIANQQGYPQAFLLPEYVDENVFDHKEFDVNDRDALFEDAAKLIVQSQSGSTSLLQRRMKLGYNRAGRLMDQLEAAGIVGPNRGDKIRDVLIKTNAKLEKYLNRN